MRVTFLGVRGSIPVSDAAMLGVGGHTSAVAVSHRGELPSLVLDAGTGLRQWGRIIGPAAFRGTIILSHLHWDHIIGLPFFRGADHPDGDTTVLVPNQPGGGPEELLARMMSPPAFPVRPSGLRGGWRYASYDEGRHDVEDFDVLAREIPHKGGRTMGLRITDGTTSVAYLSDHAPQDLGAGEDGTGALHEAALELTDFADLLIHDAQYTKRELPARGHFGHAAAEYAVKLADVAGARRVMLFHHDPDRTDAEVAAIARAAAAAATVEVDVARDGMSMALDVIVPGVCGE